MADIFTKNIIPKHYLGVHRVIQNRKVISKVLELMFLKITTKLQNSHHSEPSEIKLNESLTITELKKPHPSRLVGGM